MRRFCDRFDFNYPEEIQEDYYDKIFAGITNDFAAFNFYKYHNLVVDLNEEIDLASPLKRLARDTTVTHPSTFTTTCPPPDSHSMKKTMLTTRALIGATIVHQGELDDGCFQRQERFIMEWHYSWTPHRRGEYDGGQRLRQDAPLEHGILYVEFYPDNEFSDDGDSDSSSSASSEESYGHLDRFSYSLDYLWQSVLYTLRNEREWQALEAEGNFDPDHDVHSATDSKFATITTQFLRLMLLLRCPLEMIDEWYSSIPYSRSVNNCFRKGFIDSHFLNEPCIAVLLFILRCQKQERTFRNEGKTGRDMSTARGGIGLSTGRVDARDTRPKKTRMIFRLLVESIGEGHSFEESDRMLGAARNANLGQFYQPNRLLGSLVYGALLSRALYLCGIFYNAPIATSLETCFYNSQHLKYLARTHDVYQLMGTGLHSVLQYQVGFTIYNKIVHFRQRLTKRDFNSSLVRDPCNQFIHNDAQFEDCPVGPKFHRAPVILPGLHIAFLGTCMLENTNFQPQHSARGSTDYRLPTYKAPALVSRQIEAQFHAEIEAHDDLPARFRGDPQIYDLRNETMPQQAQTRHEEIRMAYVTAELKIEDGLERRGA